MIIDLAEEPADVIVFITLIVEPVEIAFHWTEVRSVIGQR